MMILFTKELKQAGAFKNGTGPIVLIADLAGAIAYSKLDIRTEIPCKIIYHINDLLIVDHTQDNDLTADVVVGKIDECTFIVPLALHDETRKGN